jgi:hypothetical protein
MTNAIAGSNEDTLKCDLMISRNRAEQNRCYLQSGGDVLPAAWLKFADIHYLLRE